MSQQNSTKAKLAGNACVFRGPFENDFLQIMGQALAFASAFFGVFLFGASAVSAMDFSAHFNGAMRIDNESSWIYADGQIEVGDTEKFEKFLSGQSIFHGQRVVINSPGGNFEEGMKLGRLIRQQGFRTAVAKTVQNGEFSTPTAGICASACVFAFAGGVAREASEGSKVGVHQLAIDMQSFGQDATFSSKELGYGFSGAQRAIGIALTYFMEMGIDPTVVQMMVGTLAVDVRWLTPEEVQTTKIAFLPSRFLPWKIEAYKNGLVIYSRSQDGKKQLTLFCDAKGRMKFTLVVEGGPHSLSFISDVHPSQFSVAGKTVKATNAKMRAQSGKLVISGPWSGEADGGSAIHTFSLYGEVIGTLADIYSLYDFNKTNFEVSVKLAEKNCLSMVVPSSIDSVKLNSP